MTRACVHLSADIDVQWRRVGRRAYRLLGEVRWRTPRLRTVLRGWLVSHAGSTHVPVIGNLLASRSRRRTNPGTISAYTYIYVYYIEWRSMSEQAKYTWRGGGEADAGKYVINSRAIRRAIHSCAVITRAKNADTGRTRNRNESCMRCRARMCQRASPALILMKGNNVVQQFLKVFYVKKREDRLFFATRENSL